MVWWLENKWPWYAKRRSESKRQSTMLLFWFSWCNSFWRDLKGAVTDTGRTFGQEIERGEKLGKWSECGSSNTLRRRGYGIWLWDRVSNDPKSRFGLEESGRLIADIQVSLSFSLCIEASHPKQHLSPQDLTHRIFKLLLQLIYAIHAQRLRILDLIQTSRSPPSLHDISFRPWSGMMKKVDRGRLCGKKKPTLATLEPAQL
jgi:hypothetical protein